MNVVGDITDSIAKEIGDLNQFKVVLGRMGEKLKDLSYSWTSVKDMMLLVVSFLSFFILYVTVYFADAAFLYSWTLIYVFSPLIFALYIFPSTAVATKSLFRSILEVSLWKIIWASMAALLWSTALSDINRPEYHIDFLTAFVLNLMLALSVLVTPIVVRSLVMAGASSAASTLQNALMGAVGLTPSSVISKPKALFSFAATRGATASKSALTKSAQFAQSKNRKTPNGIEARK